MPEKFYDIFLKGVIFHKLFTVPSLISTHPLESNTWPVSPAGFFFVRDKTFSVNAVQPSPIAKLDRRAGLYPRKSIQSRPLFVYPYF